MGIIAEQWVIDECVHLSVHRATGLRRLTGLIGRRELAAAGAMRFARCCSVHGIGMTRSLDVVFVDSRGTVTSVRALAPWRVVGDRSAVDAFELRRGEAAQLGIVAGSQVKQLIEGEQ
jgi:uncharacterized membrane protein (UPF0127 family)